MQSRIGSDCHIRAAEVVINGSDHADDVQVTAAVGLFRGDLTCAIQNKKRQWVCISKLKVRPALIPPSANGKFSARAGQKQCGVGEKDNDNDVTISASAEPEN